MKRALTALLILSIAGFAITACGDDDDAAAEDEASIETVAGDTASENTGVEHELETGDSIEGTIEELGDPGFVDGGPTGGSAVLVVGDQEWTFDSAFCAFGEDQIGQEGAEFNMSARQDGLQVYVSIDSAGENISLNDVDNFEDPSVFLESTGATINIDGKNVSGESDFRNDLTEETGPGTFVGTCP